MSVSTELPLPASGESRTVYHGKRSLLVDIFREGRLDSELGAGLARVTRGQEIEAHQVLNFFQKYLEYAECSQKVHEADQTSRMMLTLIEFFASRQIDGRTKLISIPLATRELCLQQLIQAVTPTHETIPLQRIASKDRSSLSSLIGAILQKRRLASPPSPQFTPGDSKGFLFQIKEQDSGKVRGYLFGTCHSLLGGPELVLATKISKFVQEKLYECALLGTEIQHKWLRCAITVEGHLGQLAEAHQISNIGIDWEGRDAMWDVENREPPKEIESMFMKHSTELIKVAKIYEQGNFKQASSFCNQNAVSPFLQTRDETMASTIDQCLQNLGSEKGFFAVGFGHLFPAKNNLVTLITNLQTLGWEVEFLPQSQHEKPFSIFNPRKLYEEAVFRLFKAQITGITDNPEERLLRKAIALSFV